MCHFYIHDFLLEHKFNRAVNIFVSGVKDSSSLNSRAGLGGRRTPRTSRVATSTATTQGQVLGQTASGTAGVSSGVMPRDQLPSSSQTATVASQERLGQSLKRKRCSSGSQAAPGSPVMVGSEEGIHFSVCPVLYCGGHFTSDIVLRHHMNTFQHSPCNPFLKLLNCKQESPDPCE